MATWLKSLAIVALCGFPIAVIGNRLGLFHFGISFQIIKYTLLLALAVFFVSMIVSLKNRKTDAAKSNAARLAIYISLIPIIGLGTQIFSARSVPEIHNITTDTADPPRFNKVIARRGANSNPHEYIASELAAVQAAAYPEIKTYFSDKPSSALLSKSKQIIEDLGWELVSYDAATGIIEATETTALWAFKDDVVVRIGQRDGKSVVDLTSVSRIGRSDLGANAKRINAFLTKLKK